MKYVVVKKQKSFLANLARTLLEMFPNNPSADVVEVHKGGWAIPIVLLKNAGFILVLIYYTVVNTKLEMSKKFLSLNPTIRRTSM